MKHILFSLMMLVTTSTLLFSQSTDEQAVRQTVDGIQAAFRSNDADAAGRFLADDYGFIASGVAMNKVQRLASVKELKYESFNYEDIKVFLSGNTAIVRTTMKCKLSGEDTTTVPVAFTLVKKDEQWQVIGECQGSSCDR